VVEHDLDASFWQYILFSHLNLLVGWTVNEEGRFSPL
jgi:hypothetical protein